MFQVDDIIRYGMSGVCKISERVLRMVGKEAKEYFVLRPVWDERSTLYLPTDNDLLMGKIHPVLSEKQAQDLLEQIPELSHQWIADDDERRKIFKAMLIHQDRSQLLCVVKTLLVREADLRSKGKKLRMEDETALRAAEKLLYDEIAFVLGMERTEAERLVREKIS